MRSGSYSRPVPYSRVEVVATGVRTDERTGATTAKSEYVIKIDNGLKKIVQTNQKTDAGGDEVVTTFVAVLVEIYVY